MRTAYRSTLRAGLLALVVTFMVVAPQQTATGLPGGCTSTWDNGGGDGDWETAQNWSGDVLPTATSVACISTVTIVTVSTPRTVAALHLDSELDVLVGGRLLINGGTVSQWGSGSFVGVFGGTLGGTGLIEAHGDVSFTNGTVLTSINAAGGTAYGGSIGTLKIKSDGEMRVEDGLALYTRYRIDVEGSLTLINDTSFMTGDWGTITDIFPGGRFTIDGDGGYYQGFPVTGQPLSFLGNHGILEKTSGSGTSVIDAWYSQAATGTVAVNCCGTLALPDATAVGAKVVQNMTFATAACGPNTNSVCQGSVNPAVDMMNVKLHIPAANSQVAGVQLQELGQPPATVDSRAIGNEVFAHADQLDVDPANPATISLRFSQADVMATPLTEIQVGHISDAGVMTKTPDCVSGAIPPGAPYCVDRATMSRTTQNTFITVLTTQTSRWRVRRNAPGESFDQTAPGAPQGLTASLAAKDGSAVTVAWSPPANDGGAALTAYRIFRDGTLLTSVGGTSLVIKDSGPGEHVFKVAAVNAIGEGAAAAATIKLDKLSRPRKVEALRGAAGGKLTAGAKWKPPADAGGFAITKYKIAVFKPNGKKVDTKVVTAAKRRYLFTLKPGKYVFKVRARNVDRWGPWSKPTDPIRPR